MPEWFVVVDGKEHEKHDNIIMGSIVFSPDSQRLAYGAQKDFQRFKIGDNLETARNFIVESGRLILDGISQKQYDAIGVIP